MTVADELLEKCLRALYHAPADKPSFDLLVDMHGSTEGLKAAIEVAYATGRESVWAEATTEYRVYHVHHEGGGKCFVDRYSDYQDAREAADFFANSDPRKSNHWVERTETVEREVPLNV
jgi:hypothetical protein